MESDFQYGTISEAINAFKRQGYTIDFNLSENCIVCEDEKGKFTTEDFEIVNLFRYEGDSDPGDEATVYAIESKSGLKGILVSGYGISSDSATTKTLEKLHFRKKPENAK